MGKYKQVALGIECDGEWISISNVCERLNKAEEKLAASVSPANTTEHHTVLDMETGKSAQACIDKQDEADYIPTTQQT